MQVVLIGLGEAGATLHLPALADLRGATVAGAADPSEQARRAVSARWQIPVFATADELLARTAPDLVIVGTPPSTHADDCLRALTAGAHVLCEKPFACSVTEADEVIDAARAAGRRVALNHEFRAMPIYRAVLGEIGRPRTGDLMFAQAWQNLDMPPGSEPGWRGALRHRTLFEAGVHLVDLVTSMFGERPRAVSATTSDPAVDGGTRDAVALVTLEFSGGRLAQVVQSRICRGEPQYLEVRADCAKASLRASFGGRARISAGLFRSSRPHVRVEFGASGIAWRERGTQRALLARNPKTPNVAATRQVFRDTFAALTGGTAVPTSAETARDILAVIAAAYRSAEIGQRVALGEVIPPDVADLRMGV